MTAKLFPDDRIIDDLFNGDCDEYNLTIENGRKDLVSWNDIALASSHLPELEYKALRIIETRLGYIPHECVHIPFQPYLRTLINQFNTAQISKEKYLFEIEEHIKLIRNKDMVRGGWDKNISTSEKDINYYNNHDTVFRDVARNRIVKLLGYAPDLKYSLYAEMKMRRYFHYDYSWEDGWYSFDFKIATIISFRKILIELGSLSAQVSSLLGIKLL